MNAAMFVVAALYRFTPLPDCAALVAPLAATARANGIKGTLLLAREGINGTLAGPADGMAIMLTALRALPGCAALEIKQSSAATMPFHRLKVRVKPEIVTMGQPDIDPTSAGTYVAPEDWNDFIRQPGTILIDTRNDYEVAIGSFAGAIDPQTPSFRDFPAWFAANRDAIAAAPRVAMFCTGGIRCEKSTAFLKAQGVQDVHHLRGGILKYLEIVPPEASLWQGECFVFDERVSVGHALAPGTHHLCRACRRPVSPDDRTSPHYEEGISCPACHASRSDEQRAGYRERHRQEGLAQQRGVAHVGATLPPHDD
jgi:UPF0176 protein